MTPCLIRPVWDNCILIQIKNNKINQSACPKWGALQVLDKITSYTIKTRSCCSFTFSSFSLA